MSDDTPEKPDPIHVPAIHTDTLWDGPRMLENATDEPVYVETKREYFDLLNKHGLRMKDQQESTTGPEREIPVEIPLEFQPTLPPAPFTADEGRIFGAMTAFFRQYGYREALYCQQCFTRKRHHGCSVTVSEREVAVRCRCGTARYAPPVGTTDLVLQRFTTASMTSDNRTSSVVVGLDGIHQQRPAIILADLEASLVRQYFTILIRRQYEPMWFHTGCWTSGRINEDEEVAMQVTDDEIVMICPCQTVYARRKRVTH